MIPHPTIDSADWFFKQKLSPEINIDDSQRTINSSPVENCHADFHCSGGFFGVAVPTTFSVLDGNKQQSLKFDSIKLCKIIVHNNNIIQ